MIKISVNGKVYEREKGFFIESLIKEAEGISMPCGGHGKCGKCKVYVKGNVNPLTENEKRLLTEGEIEKGIRLACNLIAEGECEITLSDNFGKAEIITEGFMGEFSVNHDFSSYGVAVDIGTTTLCARLYDKNGRCMAESSCLNSQKAWGADVISRIEADLKGDGKALSSSVSSDINYLIEDMAKKADILPEGIESLVVTGNTAMLHFLTNTDTSPLSKAPFKAERLFGEELAAKDINLTSLKEDAKVYLPPCISAFVGGDVVCALLAADIYDKKGTNLLVDIGTNGEAILLKDKKLTVCSTAAGPAFEGAGLAFGMMGRSGAIDKVWTENGKIAFHVIGDGKAKGICGSGIIDAVASLLKTEEIDETGYMEEDFLLSEGVYVTKDDVRAIQLAKSAIKSGVETLLNEDNTAFDDVESFVIAGGFGKKLDITSAELIGLIPKGVKKKARIIGNGALSGASMLLLDRSLREKCIVISKSAKNIELSTNAFFIDKYMENMMF